MQRHLSKHQPTWASKPRFDDKPRFSLCPPLRTQMDISRLILFLAVCTCLCCFDSATCRAQNGNGYSAPAFAGNLPWDARQQYYEQIPSDRGGFDEFDSPLDRLFRQAARQSWLQFDYVQWNIGQIPDDLLGAQVPGVDRPDLGFVINDTTTGAPPLDPTNTEQTSYVPRLGEIDQNNMPGLRLTYGLETNFGTFESNVFWILPDTSNYAPGPFLFRGATIPGNQATRFTSPLIDPNGVVAIPFSINGVPSNQALIFDRSFRIAYDSSMVGTEFNFIWDDGKPRNGLHFQYILGFRYLKFDEQMSLFGTDDQIGAQPDANGGEVTFVKTTTIQSRAINQLFGPQIGTKIELVDDRVTFGARPMFTFAFNHLDARVKTTDLFSADDPTTPGIDEATPASSNGTNQDQFAPILSLALYTKIRITNSMHLYGSYDVLFLTGVSRPAENISYDQGTVPGFGVIPNETTVLNQGFSVGTLIEF